MSPPFHEPSQPTPASARRTSSPRLWVVHHPDARFVGLSIPLGQGDTVLGRHRTALEGALCDSKLSREHCRVRRQGIVLSVEDLGSRNGTTVDGRPITTSPLLPGSLLGIGRLLFYAASGPNLPTHRHPRLVGVSPQWRAVLATLRTAVDHDGPVLIQGERGTGKQHVCDALHRRWATGGALVEIAPDSPPDRLLDALREPHHDTVVLSRVDQTSASLQARLLHFLSTELARARLVTISESPLKLAVADGQFDPQLWARLALLTIDTPPLRERRMDIAVLAHHIAAQRMGSPVPFTRALTRRLLQDPWADNIDGLQAALARLATESSGTPWEVPDWLPALPGLPSAGLPTPRPATRVARPSKASLAELVERHNGDVGQVAEALQCPRSQVYRWLRQDGIKPSGFRR